MKKMGIRLLAAALFAALVLVSPGIRAFADAGEPSAPWVCPNCGQENTTRFCEGCGAEKPSWICSCGRVNSGNKFCGDCGKSLAEQLEAFNKAMEQAASGRYAEAIAGLEALGSFDSGSFETSAGQHAKAGSGVAGLYYKLGLYLQENGGSHEEILACFEKAGDYGDAAEQAEGENARYRRSLYDAGAEHLEKGEYEEAVAAFTAAGDYMDAAQQVGAAYYAQGLGLMEEKQYRQARAAFKNAGEYEGAGEKIREAYFLEGTAAADAGKTEEARKLLKSAGSYPGAKERLDAIAADEKEQAYSAAAGAMEDRDYGTAEKLFRSLGSYRDAERRTAEARAAGFRQKLGGLRTDPKAMSYDDCKKLEDLIGRIGETPEEEAEKELVSEIRYLMGQYHLQNRSYYSAFLQFRDAGSFRDAPSQAADAAVAAVQGMLDNGKAAEAIDFITLQNVEALAPGRTDNLVVAQAGSSGDAVGEILALVRPAGIRGSIPDGEKTCREEYVPALRELEEHFGFEADGKITLKEYTVLRGAIRPGTSSYRTGSLLEKLADLSFLGKLPSAHETYEEKYASGVRKAEKQLGLLADGIVTEAEYDRIMGLEAEKPAAPAKFRASVKGDTVTLTWSAVPGAVRYKVLFCEGDKGGSASDRKSAYTLALLKSLSDSGSRKSTEKTGMTLTGMDTDKTYYVYVTAEKYTVSGDFADLSVQVPRYFKPVTPGELNRGGASWAESYVKLNRLRIAGWAVMDESGGWHQSESDARTAQSCEGYDLYLLAYSGNDYVEIVLKNYVGWEWSGTEKDPLGLACRGKLKTVSVEAQVQDGVGMWDKSGIVPTVEASHIWWEY